MKKSLIILVFFAVSASFTFAQENHFGLKAGINLTTLKFSGGGASLTPDRAIKPHFGFYMNSMITDNVAIQPELLYSGGGYKAEEGAIVDKIDLNYITVPVLLKYYITETFNLHAGPQLGFLVGGTKVNGVSITEGTKGTEISLAFGTEVSIGQKAGLSMRYVAGVSNTDDTGLGIDQKSSTIQFSLLLRLN